MPTWLYELAYGVSRGFWDAYFDAIAKRDTAKDEKPNPDDVARRSHFHDAWKRMQPGTPGTDAPKPADPAQGQPNG